jgi:hypothetical protein
MRLSGLLRNGNRGTRTTSPSSYPTATSIRPAAFIDDIFCAKYIYYIYKSSGDDTSIKSNCMIIKDFTNREWDLMPLNLLLGPVHLQVQTMLTQFHG